MWLSGPSILSKGSQEFVKLQKVVPSEVVVDNDDETLVLVFDEALSLGEGVLEINFNGVLNEHMKGFYKGYFFYLLSQYASIHISYY